MASSSGMFRERWQELASVFLKLGALSYGGSAMLGIMQAEIAERRRWLSNERYLDGVGIVNLLPGPPAVQLSILIGYDRGGWRGGILAGLSFMLPAFFILLGLTLAYSAYGTMAVAQGALYGMGMIVLAIFASAVYRLGQTALKRRGQIAIAIVAGLVAAGTNVGVASILLIAGCIGIVLYHARTQGLAALLVVSTLLGAIHLLISGTGDAHASLALSDPTQSHPALIQLAAIFMKIGAVTFGGGIVMIALVQEQVVTQMQWLTEREFLDGLALGQLTPGPTLMIAAYVGYKVASIAGAVVSTLSMFLPEFVLMLALLPVLERFQHLQWIKPAMSGVSAAVIGCLVVTLFRLAPHAAPDLPSKCVLLAAVVVLCRWRLPPLPMILVAAMLGIAVQGLR